MTTLDLSRMETLVGVGLLIAVFAIWHSSLRVARRTTEAAHAGSRMVSLTGRVLVTAAVIVAVQWLVVHHSRETGLLLAVLAVPALITAFTLVRALTVTTEDRHHRRTRQRR
ncbi:hypothetical protein E1161_21660 [Saccharopolyspora aridisoli]|uniref:Uncharacterized protein n=1 Tax=Saccharopolyspora aridisoli TaxID=2530385 RepID=A0A4R4ULJ1_9PSEU|nr:hypothetical protein [Saccharopolyspora aridisoli]TDC89303.1 hypothetical protein E1161_21660 [Saccharopolyspora aridisoli]